MGSDALYMIMGVEERFDFAMSDVVAERIATVGDLYEVVCSQVLHLRSRSCETQRMFYQVRRALMQSVELPRWYVRPKTRLDLALPASPGSRRRAVRRLRSETGVKLHWDPAESVSVGSLVRLSVAQARQRQPYPLDIPPGGWTRESVWEALKEVVIYHSGAPEHEIVPNARFVEDLKLD